MDVNYQNVLDFIVKLMYVVGPIAILFALTGKITNIFLDFVEGKRRVNL